MVKAEAGAGLESPNLQSWKFLFRNTSSDQRVFSLEDRDWQALAKEESQEVTVWYLTFVGHTPFRPVRFINALSSYYCLFR